MYRINARLVDQALGDAILLGEYKQLDATPMQVFHRLLNTIKKQKLRQFENISAIAFGAGRIERTVAVENDSAEVCKLRQGKHYFVPKILSPASPMPGRM